MNKTKIDWATMSWNPVTGCRHGCPYCYARRTATRFNAGLEDPAPLAGGLHVLPEKIKAAPYPYGFEPTLHRYRLGQPQNTKEPQTVFVCSMADLFGRWVPTSWILEVLDACAATGAVFEVNTGGMFRGYCGEPYPSRFLLEALRKSGARVTVNADAHCTEAVRFRFDETLALLRDIGFTAVTVLEDGMFVEKPL